MKPVHECDVLVIGAGMAGSCMARQIRLQQPDLRVVNIDRRTEFSYWIGESTVEAWEDYVSRTLGLRDFLEGEFPEKHGLRMYFDSVGKDLTVPEMSEFGRSQRHPHTARHLDRLRFDTRMAEINRESGIDVRLGVAVLGKPDAITLDAENGHLVETTDGPIRCRWLIDAAGKGSPLARKLDLVPTETRHRSASYWVRVRGLRPLDQMGDEAWKTRVEGIRFRSTNHFMYDGYWWWFIALDDDVVSLGVEFNREDTALQVQSKEQLMAFARSHRCLDELLGPDAEVLDFMGWVNLPRCATQHFSRDRWYLAGMSGFFADVMGSGTSRVYSECNRLVGELIRTDRGGDRALLDRQLHFFNAYMRASYEAFHTYLHHYQWYGSFDLYSNYFGAGLATYFNVTLPHCMRDLDDTIAAASMSELRFPEDFEAFFQSRVRSNLRYATHVYAHEFHQFLVRTGSYHQGNHGRYTDSLEWESREDIARKWGQPRDRGAELEADLLTWRIYVTRLLQVMCRVEGIPFDEACFEATFKPAWSSGQTLEQLLDAQRREHQEGVGAGALGMARGGDERLEPSTF